MEQSHARIMSLATRIVTAHLQHNRIGTEAIPDLIRTVCRALEDISAGDMATRAGSSHDRRGERTAGTMLVCRECGTPMKMLKRHLITVHGLTPEAYRQKWRMSPDEPMVSSDYAALRSTLAKQSGLGRRPEARIRRS
jgi:predicted transcriptional regulator